MSIAAILEQPIFETILKHLGLQAQPPYSLGARAGIRSSSPAFRHAATGAGQAARTGSGHEAMRAAGPDASREMLHSSLNRHVRTTANIKL